MIFIYSHLIIFLCFIKLPNDVSTFFFLKAYYSIFNPQKLI